MEVVHDQNNQEFKIELDQSLREKAYLTYELQGDTIDFQHTVVPSKYRGQGIAAKLVEDALKFVENQSSIKRIIPSCSYVANFLAKAPQYARYLAK